METTPPAHSKGRQLPQTGAEMMVNMVPVFGGTIAVALTVALNHKLNERRERWFTELAEAVEELQGRFDGFDPDSLAENEAFVDAVVTATRMVDRASQREKTGVLRNAVLNSALPAAPDQDIQQLYFALIDDLTPTHMRLLTLLDDPPGWFDARPGLHRPQFGMMSNRTALISAAIPDLADEGLQMIERFYAALTDGGLVNGALGGTMTAGRLAACHHRVRRPLLGLHPRSKVGRQVMTGADSVRRKPIEHRKPTDATIKQLYGTLNCQRPSWELHQSARRDARFWGRRGRRDGRTGVLDAHVELLEVRYPGREVWRVVVSGSRSVAVLGPIPRDRIITHRGEVFEKYGCALYTVAALSALLDVDDRVYPIVHVRREDEEPIKELLSAFPNVDLTGVRSASDRGAVVELRYVDQNIRIEQQIGFMDPITPADVEYVLHADAFVCVPITDYEVGQATLAYIREHSGGTILLDAHGPTSTLVVGGERRRRLWVERDSWLPHIDLLKMNLEEAGCSWFPSKIALEHHDAGAPIATEALPEFAEHCLGHGVTAVCVTLDERGCAAYWLDENGDLAERIVPRIPIEHVVDTTGAGDSFAAGLAFGYLQDADIVRAAQYGNAMGAQRCTGSTLDVYLSLPQTNKQLADTYGTAFEG